MELTGVGGGLMLAIAAALWLVYLVPNWYKRREYLATERNAVRLQQTIRVLAETAEVPAAVRAEAAARQLALAQRAEYRQGPVSVGSPVRRRLPSDAELVAAARRVRRTRAITAVALLASVVVAVAQLVVLVTGAAVATTWAVLAVAVAAAVFSAAALGRIAEVVRARRAPAAEPVARRTTLGPAEARLVTRTQPAWTPVAVPKPLYLSRTNGQVAVAADPTVELKRAAVDAERALRDAEKDVAPLPLAPTAPPSRFASMGIVEPAGGRAPDLDAVFTRRRAVG